MVVTTKQQTTITSTFSAAGSTLIVTLEMTLTVTATTPVKETMTAWREEEEGEKCKVKEFRFSKQVGLV